MELIGNNSSLVKEEDRLLKNSLKNSSGSVRSMKNSKEGVGEIRQNIKPAKFKE